MSTITLILIAVAAIGLLLYLVMKLKLPAFVALLLVAVGTGIASGIPVEEIIPKVVEEGMGSTLGSVALLVGLGAMLGAIVEQTGGAEVLARKFTRLLGPERVGPALLTASAVIAVPIFFDVAFIIFVPMIFSFAKAAGHRSPIYVGVPISGLMVFIHNVVPPHPGVTTSSTLLGADLGLVTICGLLLAIPMGVLAYYTSRWITSRREFVLDPTAQERFDRLHSDGDDAEPVGDSGGPPVTTSPGGGGGVATTTATPTDTTTATKARTSPSATSVTGMILLPILMISIGTVGGLFLAETSTAGKVVSLIGEPGFALLVATTLAIYVLGIRHGWGREQMGKIMEASLAPAAIVVFVTGAGGVFAAALTESGIGESISGSLVGAGVPVLLLAFLLASVFKVAQGSGTVATLASAGLLQSTVASGGYTDLQVVLIVLAIGCGSVALSHINDSGFWIATRFLGLSVADGLRTWTVLATVLGWSGMALIGATWMLVS